MPSKSSSQAKGQPSCSCRDCSSLPNYASTTEKMACRETKISLKMMSDADKVLLESKRVLLMERIDLIGSTILAELRTRNVISVNQEQSLKTEPGNINQVGVLLDVLQRGDEDTLDNFNYALRKSGHVALAKATLDEPSKPDNFADKPDPPRITLQLSIDPLQSKITGKKRKQIGKVTDSVSKQMTSGDFQKHLIDHYSVSSVKAEAEHSHHHHNHFVFVLYCVSFDLVTRIRDDVENGQLASKLTELVKNEANTPQSWELVIVEIVGHDAQSTGSASGTATGNSLQEAAAAAAAAANDLEADSPDEVDGPNSYNNLLKGINPDSPVHGASARPGDRSIPRGTKTASAPTVKPHNAHVATPAPLRDCGSEAMASASINNQQYTHQLGYAPAAAQVLSNKTEVFRGHARGTKPTRTPPNQNQNRLPKKTVYLMIKNKQATKLEFYNALQDIKTNSQESILTYVDRDSEGLNIGHLCVIHDRAEFLPIIQASGLWTLVSEQKITETAADPEVAGCNLLKFAEKKRLRRMVRKIQALDELEKSMGGRNAALKYSRSGDLDGLKNAVNQPDLNKRPQDQDENNLLHWACVSGNADMVKYIVDELKVDPKKLNKQMQNPLHVAVQYGRSNLVELLLNKCRIDPRQIDVNMKTPLNLAAENGDDKTLRQLKSCAVQFDPSMVLDVAKSGSKQCMQYVIEECQLDLHVKDPEGKHCLMIAAIHGHLKLVQYLIEQRGMNIGDLSAQNRNALHYSSGKGHLDVTKYLIRKSTEESLLRTILDQKDKYKLGQSFSLVRGFDKGRAAWHYIFLKRPFIHLFNKCTKSGKVDASLVGVICKSGWGEEPELGVMNTAVAEYKEDYPHKDGQDDMTPLMLAILKGHPEIATALIEAGADVGVKDCFGQSVMHLVAMRGYLDLAQVLADKGVSLTEMDHAGITPLRVAQYNEHPELSNYLSLKGLPSIKTFSQRDVERVKKELSPERLREVRQSGQDMIKHVVQAVRGLQIDANILLMELGSGPVTEESRQSCARTR